MRTLLLASVLVTTAVSQAQDLGPIRTRNHRAPSLAFLRFDLSPNVLAFGKKSFEIGLVSTNDFRIADSGGHHIFEDQETERLSLLYREGLARGWEWSVEVPVLSRGGGFQDPIIDWWHANIIHRTIPGRDTTPFGGSQVNIDGQTFGSSTGIGDISGFISKDLGRGLIASVALKAPTGNADRLLGSGNLDAGLNLQKRWQLARKISLYGQLGAVFQGKAKKLESARGIVHQEGVAIVWQPNSRDAWIAQWQGESSALQTGIPTSDATHRLLTFGYKRRLSASQTIDMYFSEDGDIFNRDLPELANIGPDFTMGIRLNLKF